MKRPKRSLLPDAIQSVIPTQEDFELDLTERVRRAVQATIQIVLDEELERLVGAGPYERSDQRVDVRNGRYARHVVTTAGEIGRNQGCCRKKVQAAIGAAERRVPGLSVTVGGRSHWRVAP